jgi:sialate O-acetylesterase
VPFNYRTPTTLYNAMIAPLTSLTIRGVIWYQGEGGTATFKWDVFGKMTSAMIRAWRQDWGLGNFPFLMVQLPYYTAVIPDPNAEHAFASCREEQRRAAAAHPNAVAVVTLDTGHDTDIHPANKDVVGTRLALAARALAYRQKVVYQGPVAKSVEMTEGKVRVRYDHIGGGLVTKGEDGKHLEKATVKGFGLAGEDGKFVWVDAVIDGIPSSSTATRFSSRKSFATAGPTIRFATSSTARDCRPRRSN